MAYKRSNYSPCIQENSFCYESSNNRPSHINYSRMCSSSLPRQNMSVLVTCPWPMGQPMSPMERSSTAEYVGNSNEIVMHRASSKSHLRDCHSHSQQRINRPLSMPPCSMSPHPDAIELRPLNYINPQQSPSVLCRATLPRKQTSPPSCVPWKMKVIKKIQRKIGIGTRGGGISPNNMPPLLFHNVHGENVIISQNGTTARRNNSFCKAIAFSDRAVKVNEKVCLKFTEVSLNWSGVLRIGFTSHDPSTLRNGLPRYACPDLTSKPGFWAKAFSDFFVKKDSILFYYTNSAGDVHFGINGEEKGVFFSGVDTRGPLWAMLDIYGNTTCVEFVDPRAHLNNSRRSINEASISSREEVESTMSTILPTFNGMKLSEPVVPDLPFYAESEMQELTFHRVRGKNVMLTPDSLPSIAIRRPGEYCNAYVFTARPILPDETIVIQVLHMDDAYSSSMAFGLTSCNPQVICSDSLPEDSHLLLDRPEYWVVKKDVGNNPNTRDVLAFTVSCSGEVTVAKNGGAPIVLMHVDNSVPLWAFFDMYGTTDRIRSVGSIQRVSSVQQPAQQRRSRDCSAKLPNLPKVPSLNFSKQPCLPRIQSSLSSAKSPIAQEYFELSHSPNSMEASGMMPSDRAHNSGAFNVYATVSSSATGSQSGKEPSNWSVECVACCERPVDSVFYSCGHMCMCFQCGMEYWKTKEKGCCPICRAAISDVIRTYKS